MRPSITLVTLAAGVSLSQVMPIEMRIEGRWSEGVVNLLWEEGTGRARNRSFELGIAIGL